MTDTEDPLDLFDSSLGTIFSIPPIAFSTSGSYTYNPPTPSVKAITLTLPSPPAELYTTLQANHVWLASVYLADQISLGDISVTSKRIGELGAGAGLPGITAAVSGAKEVVSSDWDTPDVLSAIKENFGNACKKGENWAVVGHTWGTDPSPLLSALQSGGEQRKFDMLLLADTLWVTQAHSVLLDSIFALLDADGIAHIAAGLHTGWGPVERFRAAAEKRGGIVSPIKVVRWQAGGGWADHALREEGLEEERGVVVYFTLHDLPS